MIPANDFILVERLTEKTAAEASGVRSPMSADLLARGKVVALGQDTCLIDGTVVLKREIIPGIQVGSIVHYLKMAEERRTEDAAVRVRPNEGGVHYLLSIKDIRAIDPA
jgi:co-chaperonin GroES (HSP10)